MGESWIRDDAEVVRAFANLAATLMKAAGLPANPPDGGFCPEDRRRFMDELAA